MVEFSSYLGISFMRTINNKSQRNDRGKCLGSPVTSYGTVRDSHNELSVPMPYTTKIASCCGAILWDCLPCDFKEAESGGNLKGHSHR